MSIIQDALRRREQEGSGGSPPSNFPPSVPVPPSAMPPAERFPPVPESKAEPPPIPTTKPAVRRRGTGWVVAAIVILLIAGGAGFWGYHAGWFNPQSVRPVAVEPKPGAAPTAPTPVAQVIEAVREIAREPAAPVVESTASSPASAPAPSASKPAAPVPPSTPAAAPVNSSPSMLDRLRGVKEGAWPKFSIRGVVSRSGGRPGMVILDQATLEEGAVSRHGIRVVEVRNQAAVLEYQGERRTYRTGEGEP